MHRRLIAALTLIVAVGSCEETKQPPPHPAGATPYTESEKAEIAAYVGSAAISTESRADAVVACGLALLQAERRGLVATDAMVPRPWQVSSTSVDGGLRVSCQAEDNRGDLVVVVDLLCTDVNNDQCHPLVRIDR